MDMAEFSDRAPSPSGGFAQQACFGPIYCEFNALHLAISLSILTCCAKPPEGEGKQAYSFEQWEGRNAFGRLSHGTHLTASQAT
jgi:hypothetical protein